MLMLYGPIDRLAATLLRYSPPIFFVAMFVLAEIPILPIGGLLGPYSAILNLSAVLATVVSLRTANNTKESVRYFVLAKRLGLHPDKHENYVDFFERPLTAWFWLLLDFTLLWLALVMATGSVLYNLAAVSGLYNPFVGDVGLQSVFYFVLDQGLKGILFDIAGVFKLTIPSQLDYVPSTHPLFATFLVVFRMAITISFVQLLALYLGIYLKGKDPRLFRIAEVAIEQERTGSTHASSTAQ